MRLAHAKRLVCGRLESVLCIAVALSCTSPPTQPAPQTRSSADYDIRIVNGEVIDGDDEVAVLVHPTTNVALTVPNVNVRFVAYLAARRGILSRSEAQQFVQSARNIFYMDRSWQDVIELLPGQKRAAITAIAQKEGGRKRWDASFALRSTTRRLGLLHVTA